MIAFEHGTLQQKGEPLLVGLLAHSVLAAAGAHILTFLACAEQLTAEEWTEIVTTARELRAERLPAVRRLRDAIAFDEPRSIAMLANALIAVIAHTLEQELRDEDREAIGVVQFAGTVVIQLTTASNAIELCNELGAVNVAQLHAPFETMIPLTSLG
jgi:hypothetical protein